MTDAPPGCLATYFVTSYTFLPTIVQHDDAEECLATCAAVYVFGAAAAAGANATTASPTAASNAMPVRLMTSPLQCGVPMPVGRADLHRSVVIMRRAPPHSQIHA